jgi:CRISPR type IV-associated protein Csf3
MAMTKIYGRFDSFNIDHAVTKKKRLPIMSGHYKSRMVSLPVMPSKNVKFYARGNIDECKWIFGSVPNLGKDRGKGFGEVISFSIEEIPEDYSLFRDSVVMHPIPISEYHLELLPGTDIKTMNLTYTPPYWDTGRAKPCIAPGSILPKSKKATEDLYFDAVEELNAGSTA